MIIQLEGGKLQKMILEKIKIIEIVDRKEHNPLNEDMELMNFYKELHQVMKKFNLNITGSSTEKSIEYEIKPFIELEKLQIQRNKLNRRISTLKKVKIKRGV